MLQYAQESKRMTTVRSNHSWTEYLANWWRNSGTASLKNVRIRSVSSVGVQRGEYGYSRNSFMKGLQPLLLKLDGATPACTAVALVWLNGHTLYSCRTGGSLGCGKSLGTCTTSKSYSLTVGHCTALGRRHLPVSNT